MKCTRISLKKNKGFERFGKWKCKVQVIGATTIGPEKTSPPPISDQLMGWSPPTIDVKNVEIKIKKTFKNVKNVTRIKKTFVNVE